MSLTNFTLLRQIKGILRNDAHFLKLMILFDMAIVVTCPGH